MTRRITAAWHAALLALAACALPATGHAAARSFQGTVTHVSDGDTLWVRPVTGGRPRAVRLLGVDAPELCQPFGEQARHALAQRVLRQPVTVQGERQDDYDRLLARVAVDGQDLGRWLVAGGHAWSYRWRHDPGPYAAEQVRARQARRGLWAQAAVEPRSFRRSHGPCSERSAPVRR
jgi:micrococcal nuclease